MTATNEITIGVLALQGAFEEHQECIEKGTGCKTIQVKTPAQLEGIDGIIFPGGESTAMGLIGSVDGMWTALKAFTETGKPVWGTCAGMILLAERCVGGSAVIENGQSLIGGLDILVCRNYFGSQVSSFEMATPAPPGFEEGGKYPGIFIRAPAILTVGEGIEVLGKVVATPCRQAAVVLRELENKIANGENVVMMNVIDALERKDGLKYVDVKRECVPSADGDEKKDLSITEMEKIELPGAADGTNAREVICAARKNNILITAFHPEITTDYRWHKYFYNIVKEASFKC
jgi:5'-phosphate synthase pdxT subunit